MRRAFRIVEIVAVAAVCGCLLVSCASVEAPVVTLTGLEVRGLSTEGIEFTLLADVQNPNDFGADVRDLEYSVFLDDVRVARGEQTETVPVGANSSVEVGIPFTLLWGGMDEKLSHVLDDGEHDWRLKGSVRISKGALSKTFRFSEGGRFDVPAGGKRGPRT
jgi:LEA14-like dessication related protein